MRFLTYLPVFGKSFEIETDSSAPPQNDVFILILDFLIRRPCWSFDQQDLSCDLFVGDPPEAARQHEQRLKINDSSLYYSPNQSLVQWTLINQHLRVIPPETRRKRLWGRLYTNQILMSRSTSWDSKKKTILAIFISFVSSFFEVAHKLFWQPINEVYINSYSFPHAKPGNWAED